MAGLLTKGIKLTVDGTALPNLQATPEMGGTPEQVDVTTLADDMRHYIAGVKDPGSLEFTFLYDADQEGSSYKTLTSKVGHPDSEYVLTMPDSSTFTFTADVSLRLSATEVNGAITFIASMSLQSDIEFAAASAG